MDQRDHIATLCVAGTVGIAATGLALGVQTGHDSSWSSAPGKRKWPGASSSKTNNTMQTTLPSRRVVSQPVSSNKVTMENKTELSRTASLFRRQSRRDVQPPSENNSDMTGSRASSLNRSGLFRPRTADTRSTSEHRDPSAGSSWLKRISMVSSPRASSPSAASSNQDSTPQSTASFTPDHKLTLRNRLVKRSASQRALSNDQASGTFFRRPATSHQRSATVQEYTLHETSFSTPVTPYLGDESSPIWRPFFSSGYQRKRHASAHQRDNMWPRTLSVSNIGRPTLILGSQVEAFDEPQDRSAPINDIEPQTHNITNSRQRLKRSLSSIHRASRRRHVTDPTTQVTTEAVNGTITSSMKHSPLSPLSYSLPFDTELSNRSPSFNSSPPVAPTRHKFAYRKRQSTAPSDPTTISSDNDTRIFTDDDSMDFQSDTAYDSLTTRATASSHSAFRSTKLDTIFNSPQTNELQEDTTLASLVQRATLDDKTGQESSQQTNQLRGIGIEYMAEQGDEMDFEEESALVGTPVRSGSPVTNEFNMTPVPQRLQLFETPLHSSPPKLTYAAANSNDRSSVLVLRPRAVEEDSEEIDWSPKSEKQEKSSQSTLRPVNTSNPLIPSLSPGLPQSLRFTEDIDERDSDSEKRLSSIFDWSEHQKVGVDAAGGMAVRPRTVHGKQGNDGSRSRSSGRRGPTQIHLRSQSVPNNRDPNAEQTPLSTSKFGTWGLGNKGVSEEWSDDFDFGDEEDSQQVLPGVAKSPELQKPSRGVKVPQSIMDRQVSVHLQFGQVQEFMLLVEELKQLRARGAALQLLDTHSKQLWEDAETIIDLATINNERDDQLVHPNSPTSSDIFTEETPAVTRSDEPRRSATLVRSTSNPATPPHGRPRGESLAHAKNFLHSIHQSRSGMDSSPMELNHEEPKKLPFDTQDLKDLVVRSGIINRALKEIVRKAEGLSASPSKTPPRPSDPAFSQIFTAPDSSPCPPFRKPGIPKSRSANSYPFGMHAGSSSTAPTSPKPMALVS